MAAPRLWTIGYGDRDLDDLIGTLQKADVEHVADVRELPLSRKKGMSKGPLSQALVAAGIGYTHHKALGAPKRIREPFLAGGEYVPFRIAYLRHLATQRPALDDLDQCAQGKKDGGALPLSRRGPLSSWHRRPGAREAWLRGHASLTPVDEGTHWSGNGGTSCRGCAKPGQARLVVGGGARENHWRPQGM